MKQWKKAHLSFRRRHSLQDIGILFRFLICRPPLPFPGVSSEVLRSDSWFSSNGGNSRSSGDILAQINGYVRFIEKPKEDVKNFCFSVVQMYSGYFLESWLANIQQCSRKCRENRFFLFCNCWNEMKMYTRWCRGGVRKVCRIFLLRQISVAVYIEYCVYASQIIDWLTPLQAKVKGWPNGSSWGGMTDRSIAPCPHLQQRILEFGRMIGRDD